MASFFTMVWAQIYFEQTMMAAEKKILTSDTKKLEKLYEPLLKEAKSFGFKSEKPGLLVNYWASWCKPCIKEFKSMKKLTEKLDNVSILGVNQDDTDSEMKRVIKRRKLKFFSYRDKNTKMADMFGVEEYPYSIFFCKGKLKAIYKGETDFTAHKILEKIQSCKKD